MSAAEKVEEEDIVSLVAHQELDATGGEMVKATRFMLERVQRDARLRSALLNPGSSSLRVDR